jgi:transposase
VSQSLLYHAFGVREGYEYVRTEYPRGTVEFHLAVADRLLVCPHCQSRELIRKGKRFRRLQTVPIGLKPVWLVTEVPRCQCRGCGQVFEVAPPLPQRMSTIPGG